MFFIVILNLGNVIPDESVELVPKFTLRRATSGEVELIKPLLASHMTIGDLAELFEKQKVVMVDSEKEYQAILEPLPLDRHRYFVIACQEKSDDLKPNLAAIRVAAMLSSSGLILGPTIETKASGILTGWDSVSLFNYFYGISPLGKTNIFVNFDTAKLMEFCSIYELWTKHDNDAFDLLSRINEFQGLRRLERNSKFLVLGCFSIIESIITHKPDPKDPANSIEVRFIEVKGRAFVGEVALSSNEYRTAQRLREDYWLYAVFDCATTPKLNLVRDPARLDWEAIVKVEHYHVGPKQIQSAASEPNV